MDLNFVGDTLTVLLNRCLIKRGKAYSLIRELNWTPPTQFSSNMTLVDEKDGSIYQLDIYMNRAVLIPKKASTNFLKHYNEVIEILVASIKAADVSYLVSNEVGYKLFTYAPIGNSLSRYHSKKTKVTQTVLGSSLGGEGDEYVFEFKFDSQYNLLEPVVLSQNNWNSTWLFPNTCSNVLDVSSSSPVKPNPFVL